MLHMNLAGAFSESVQKHSEKTALFWGDAKFSYSELWSRSLFVAGILRHQFNIQPGDRVALWLKNCPEFIPALFGVLQTGGGRGAHQQFSQAGRSRLHSE